jgi:hypothetical protein
MNNNYMIYLFGVAMGMLATILINSIKDGGE